MNRPRILIAGIGNLFLGDDGFGVEVVRRLTGRALPDGVQVRDFGIRGFDLAMALLEGWDQVLLADAAKRGGVPGSLYLMKVDPGEAGGSADLDVHGMVPSRVLRAVRSMGAAPRQVFVVACEPEDFGDPDTGRVGLSPSVEAAVPGALEMVERLVRETLLASETHA
jgi:hydrogenase maturation protease